jgi:hypothetical protein
MKVKGMCDKPFHRTESICPFWQHRMAQETHNTS